MISSFRSFAVLTSMIFLITPLRAQGVLKGTVVDSQSGEALVGAHVVVVGTAMGTASDPRGEFMLPIVPVGVQTIRVSYIGYRTGTFEVRIDDGATAILRAPLQIDAIEGAEVVVTAQALGQAAAINQQLTSNTISNVVSADRIVELPDANAAESVGRLPGVSIVRSGGEGNKVVIRGLSPTYNAITIGGDRIPATDLDDRSVDLSMIAPEILAGIEVTKALTPDKDADALGGTVDFQLSTAPRGGFRSNARAQNGYNNERAELGEYKARLITSNRYFDELFGVLLTINMERTQRGSDQFNATYAVAREKREGEEFAPITTNSVTFEQTHDVRSRLGFSAMLDYEIPGGKIMLNNFVSRLERNELVRTRRFDFAGSNKMKYYLREREQQIDIITSSLAGTHDATVVKVDWRLSRSVSETRYPFNSRFEFQEMNAFNAAAIPQFASPDDILQNAYDNTDQAFLYDGEVEPERSYERDLSAQLNIKIPYSIASWLAGELKLGGKHRDKYRERDRDYATKRLDITESKFAQFHSQYGTPGFVYARMPGTNYAYMSNYLDPAFDAGKFLDGQYDFGVGLSQGELRYFLERYLYDQQYRFSLQRDLDDYEITDRLSAGYIMTEINLGRMIMILPGVRYEHTLIDAVGRTGFVQTPEDEGLLDNEQVRDTTATIRYDRWFPMFHIRVRPTEWFDVRLAYTNSISYPRLDYVLPAKKIKGSETTVVYGRPQLRPQLSENFDAYLSFYSNRIGLFTLGAFYKDITDLIYLRSGHKILDPVKEGVEQSLLGYFIVRPENNPFRTEVYGFEVEWQTNLKWLPSPFDGIVINANYSHIWSMTDFPKSFVRSERIPVFPFLRTTVVDTFRAGSMPNQASDIGNISLGYDYGGFSGRISMLLQGKTLSFVGEREELDGFTDTYVRWDLSLKYEIMNGLGIFYNLNNITNQPDQSFMQTARYATGREYYGWTTDIGVSLSL